MRFVKILFFSLLSLPGLSQHNGFYITEIPHSAAIAALGGELISLKAINSENTALLADSAAAQLQLDYMNYPSGPGLGSATYYTVIGELPFVFNVRNLSYGVFSGYAPNGTPEPEFTAGDTQISAGTRLKSGNFSVGLVLNLIQSRYEIYNALATSVDLSGSFQHPEKDLIFAAQLKNIGVVLKNFDAQAQPSHLPLDLKLGMSFKPEHMPFRFHFTLHGLNPFENSVLAGNAILAREQKLFVYLVSGGEFVLSEHFQVLAGMNFQRRYEMKQFLGDGGAGFNFGFRIAGKKYKFEFANSAFHSGVNVSYFSLFLNTGIFKKLYR